jgi:DNA-binding SARP family transcriptional activator
VTRTPRELRSIIGQEVPQTMDVAVALMGEFAVTVRGTVVPQEQWRRRQAASLVKLLALSPRRTLHREQVMDALWPGLGVDEAAPRLHKAAHYARRAMGESSSLVLVDESVSFFPHDDVHIDAQQFQVLAESALGARDPALASRAADAYRGELLPQDPYEPWAQEVRDRLHLLYVDVLRLCGRWQVLSAVEPTDEEAHLKLIAALARRGERRAALRQFERLERALAKELGVAPSPAAIRLRTRLQATEESAAEVSAEPAGIPSSTPLVGGDAERAQAAQLLDRVSAGHGQSLFVTGPAGVGKTALLAWLEHTAHDRGLRVGSGVAARIEGAWPYAPVLEALADLCRRHPALLDGLDDSLRAEIENGLSGREISWTARSGHQRLYVAAAELVRLAAAGSGVVLVVDDAHHADPASLRLIHYLARSTVSERVLLVLAYRPGFPAELADVRQSLISRGAAASLDVTPLTRDEVSALLRQVSPDVSEEFVDAVCTTSDGLPFAVLELGRRGATESATPSTFVLPPSLTDRQVQTLAAAAVLGGGFDTDEFLQVSGLAEDHAYAVLDAGVSLRLLVRTRFGYEFRHSLVRDALLTGLRPAQLRQLHGRAAGALERLDRPPARIGYHLLHAGERARAVPWLLRAAETSAALGAYQDALANLQAVRADAKGAELTRLLSLHADLLMARADAGAVDAYREALGHATDPAERLRLRARLARAATFAGDLETATIALDGLVPTGSPYDTELLLAQGNLAMFQGDLEAADAAASQARRRVTLGQPAEWQSFELIALQGLVAHNRGEWFQRLRAELRSSARRPALAAGIFDSHLCVAEFLLYGPTPYDEVIDLAGSLRETAERSGALRAVAFATALRGEAALLMGDLATADTELADAVDLHRDIGSAAGEAHSLQRLAEVKLARGEREEANHLLHRALPLARFSNIALHLIQRVYGTMISAAPDPATARAMVDHAEGALGISDRCPFCDIMLAIPAAQACAANGDLDDARRHLRAAENSAQLWEGTAWQASILEVQAYLAAATGDLVAAERLFRGAAELFAASGQPLDAQRCRLAPIATP